MVDYVKIIADKINAGTPVIIYTVSNNTICVIRMLKQRFGVLPAAICDSDFDKQGRNYHGLAGLEVLSVDKAIKEYPSAHFFIASMDNRFNIMGELTSSKKVLPEQIINFEPIVKRRTCDFFEKSVCVNDNGDLTFCWIGGSPKIPFNGDYDGCADRLREMRHSLIESCANASLPEVCAACKCVKEDWYPINTKSWWVNYFGKGICNFKCSYCCSSTHTANDIKEAPELRKIIKALLKSDVLSEFYSVVISTSGEPTLHPKRNDFFNGLDGYGVILNSNGSIFNEDLFLLMDKEQVFLIVSIDAGTSDTFKKIKGVDCFDSVKSNLEKYSRAKVGIVIPKYIVMPGINDNPRDAEGFIQFCGKTNVPSAIIAYDQHGDRPIPENATNTLRKIKQGLEEKNILCSLYTAYESYEYVEALKRALEGQR